MERNASNFTFISSGPSFLLTIFGVLALVTFAALSLVSANTNTRLVETSKTNTTAYYTACNTAAERIAALDNALTASGGNLAAAALPADWTVSGGKATTKIPINEYEELQVDAAPRTGGDSYYTITRWQTVITRQWQNDSSFTLFNPKTK
ncbi:MAG: hypothetical protein IJG85_06350 [Eubacteriaceae bacterium]|nr:hypothetical protein [Eubacteriaceae bacterium]MBR0384189.1 hypothetical protein [Eubacteriaceae bacterium]